MKAYMVMEDGKRDAAEINDFLQYDINRLTDDDFMAQFRLYKFYRRLTWDEDSALGVMWSVYKDIAEQAGYEPAYIVVECSGKKYGIYGDTCWGEMTEECTQW